MAINYPVDVENTKWSVLQVSTDQIIGRNKRWPTGDGSEIPGLDPDFVYLLEIDQTPPDFDSRLYQIESNEVVDAGANTITRSWDTVKRPDDERVIAVGNREVEELQRHVTLEREVIETRLAVTALFQFMDGLQLPPKVRKFTDAYKTKGVKLWKNRDRAKAMIAEIEAGQDPDLDAGFESVE